MKPNCILLIWMHIMHFLPVANTRVINGKDWIQIQLIKIPSLRTWSEGWDFYILTIQQQSYLIPVLSPYWNLSKNNIDNPVLLTDIFVILLYYGLSLFDVTVSYNNLDRAGSTSFGVPWRHSADKLILQEELNLIVLKQSLDNRNFHL